MDHPVTPSAVIDKRLSEGESIRKRNAKLPDECSMGDRAGVRMYIKRWLLYKFLLFLSMKFGKSTMTADFGERTGHSPMNFRKFAMRSFSFL